MEKEIFNQNAAQPEEQKIRLYGFEQVVQVLMAFDARYREQMLNRISKRDRKLGEDLRAALLSRVRGRA